jgi:hypothetical protein
VNRDPGQPEGIGGNGGDLLDARALATQGAQPAKAWRPPGLEARQVEGEGIEALGAFTPR